MEHATGDGRNEVSNPLRLEGDALAIPAKFRYRSFLIHYGWRGTPQKAAHSLRAGMFLIHYGWRGTRDVLI